MSGSEGAIGWLVRRRKARESDAARTREDEPAQGVDEEPAGRGNRPNESSPIDAEGDHNRM